MELPKSIQMAIGQLSKIPGIGERTATRHVLGLLSWEPSQLGELSSAIKNLAYLKECEHCNMMSDHEICEICYNESRLQSEVLCVVETLSDCLAIERSNQFQGSYFILGGVLNPLLGVGPDELKIPKLIELVKNYHKKTVILALNPSVEGDATCSYIKDLLPSDVETDRIGFGIPMGGTLEFLDAQTISKALENRKRM